MTYRLDESLDLEAPEVLSYLAARLDAAGGLLGGLRTATLVARGKVSKIGVASGKAPAGAASSPAFAGFVDDLGMIYVHVVDMEIGESYRAAATHVKLAFPQAMQASTGTLVLPPIGEDLVVLAAASTSPLGRAVAGIAPGTIASDGNPIFMPPELGAELRWWHAAAAKPAGARIGEALAHLGASGRLAVPALDVLLHASRTELAVVPGWLRQASGPATLLARAVLWRAGDHDAAAAGLDVAHVPREWLQAIGLSVAESDGERLGILGPSRTVPLL